MDGWLYGLYTPGQGTEGTDVNVYDPMTMAVVNHFQVSGWATQVRRIAVDDTGRMYLCGLSNIVYRLGPTGLLETSANAGTNYLSDIAVDNAGNLVIARAYGGVALLSDTSFTRFVPFQVLAPGEIASSMFVAFSPPLPSPPPLQLLSAVSRKTHGAAGTFDIELPLTGTPGIECRSKANDYAQHSVVFRFNIPLVRVGSATVSNGVGQWFSAWIGTNAHEYFFHLMGVSNRQTITLKLSDVTDAAGNYESQILLPMAVLIGDTSGNGAVNSADVGQTKSQIGAVQTPMNFRTDVNADGVVDSTDLGLVKFMSGTVVP